jgi:hypothetical protein
MLKLVSKYVKVLNGVQEEIRAVEERASGAEVEAIDAALAAWLDGTIEPLRVFPGGHANVAARETILHKRTQDPKTRKVTHERRPVPITPAHVSAAKLRPRGEGVEEYDPETGGDPIPCVRVVLDSGNKFDLPVVAPKAKGDDEGEGKAKGKGKGKG